MNYPEAYTNENLYDILDTNSAIPETFDTEQCERLLTVARQFVGDNPMNDDGGQLCVIATDWKGFAGNEFGYDGGTLNNFAIGMVDRKLSSGRGATLFRNTHVIQQTWLQTGDGRKTRLEHYLDEEYDNADRGEMWIPNGAQDYIAIVELTDELLHDDPTAADAM